jgi:hypothetical protein
MFLADIHECILASLGCSYHSSWLVRHAASSIFPWRPSSLGIHSDLFDPSSFPKAHPLSSRTLPSYPTQVYVPMPTPATSFKLHLPSVVAPRCVHPEAQTQYSRLRHTHEPNSDTQQDLHRGAHACNGIHSTLYWRMTRTTYACIYLSTFLLIKVSLIASHSFMKRPSTFRTKILMYH